MPLDFPLLCHGSASAVADELDQADEFDAQHLRAALINALRKIERLEADARADKRCLNDLMARLS